jgi:tetratricopeptide (TPR) repeat protein
MRHLLAPWVLVTALAAGPAFADQADRRLDALFGRLQITEDPAEGARITRAIWGIWFEIADEEIASLMAAGEQAMQVRRFPDALAKFDAVIEAAPGYAEGWNRRATLYYMMGEYDASIADVDRVLELEPRHFGALSGLGQIFAAKGWPEAAIDAFEFALEVNPHMPGPRLNIEYLRERLGQKDI